MKIVIEHQKTKRVIDGPFNICLSKQDLQSLASQLSAASESHTYGWIRIVERTQSSIPNTAPLKWDSEEEYEKPGWEK